MVKLATAKPKVGRESAKLDDVVDMVKLPKNKWVTIRILDIDMFPVARHWINIIAGKDKREVKIPKICLSFDPATEGKRKGVHCPYDELATGGSPEIFYLANVIVRSEQEDAPARMKKHTADEKSSGFKDPNSESWTPVKVLRITSSLMKKIQGLKELNKHKTKAGIKTFDVSHERFGIDINVKHDPDAKGAEQYQVNLGEKSALTDDEKAYLIHPFNDDLLDALGRESEAEAKKELKGMRIVGDDDMDDGDDDDDGDDGDDDIDLDDKKKKPAAKGKAATKPAAKGKRKPVDEDDEDEEDLDDDEDEDDEPVSKKSSSKGKAATKPAAKGKRKPVDEDDEDEDEDLEDEDEDEDEPVSKKKPAAKGKRKPTDEDDDDEDLDEDEDEDDEPVSKKKPAAKGKAATKPAAKGKRKPADGDDEDEDDLDDDEDDEDEDDAPPPKKSSSKGKAATKPAAKGKRKPVDEDDDDDDDIPF